MKCLKPTTAYIIGSAPCKSDGIISPKITFSANTAIKFAQRLGIPPDTYLDRNSLEFPCGHCLPCLIDKRKQLATRIAHEASLYADNTFLTLTYNDDHLPLTSYHYPTLCKSHVQLFLKRLRRHLEYHYGIKGLRYFCCGEYGTKSLRPHYHLVLFGWRPPDLVSHRVIGDAVYYRSPMIERLWIYGFSLCADVATGVAKYVAQYVTKKVTCAQSDQNVPRFDFPVEPEFSLQSTRRGGVGALWSDLYGANACQRGLTSFHNGDKITTVSVPKYYYNRLRKSNPDLWKKLREDRKCWICNHPSPTNYDMLRASCECKAQQLKYEQSKEII